MSVQVESPQEAVVIQEPVAKAEGTSRLLSLDAFRGTIMLLMLNEATRLSQVARSFPHSAIWSVIRVQHRACGLAGMLAA